MPLAFLIPVFSFVACPLIILFQRWLPGRGAPLAILAIGGGFVVWALATIGFLGASPDNPACDVSHITGALTCHFSTAWFTAGVPGNEITDVIRLDWGILIDPLTIVLLGLITFVALGVQLYSLEYMKGDPRFGWYYAWQGAVRSRDVNPGAGRQFPAVVHRLGTGGPVLLPAHWVLV